MKKVIAFILFLLLIYNLVGCKNEVLSEEEKIVKDKLEIDSKTKNAKEWKEVKLISSAKTVFDKTDLERSNNIHIAANTINGKVLDVGEKFSFNDVLGKRTEDKGYKKANTFISLGDGTVEIQKDLGGGICQVSSTIYMSVCNAELQVIERHMHSIPVSYCSRDEEAMVDFETADLSFVNSLDTCIKIELECQSIDLSTEELVCNIYSLS